jgi:SAM-dependent methyltransferase
MFDDIQKQRNEYLLKFLNGKGRLKVLDIGCQQGDLCNQLLLKGNELYGVEIVEDFLVKARGKYPTIRFEYADCEREIPFVDGFFDVVWAGDVIEHIRFTDVFVNEVNRVLKVGGLFILTTPMHNRIKNIIICLYNFEKHFDLEFPHLRFYTSKSMSNVLVPRGFDVLKVKHLGRISLLAKSMFVVAKKTADRQLLSKHRY